MLLRLNGRMVDLRRGSVTDDAGHSITTLRPQAGEILKVLAARHGEIVTKDELMQTVWGNIAVSDDSLVQCVIEIRKALGDDKHRIVRTLPKRGYVLETKAIEDNTNAIARVRSNASPRPVDRPPRRWTGGGCHGGCCVFLAGSGIGSRSSGEHSPAHREYEWRPVSRVGRNGRARTRQSRCAGKRSPRGA